MRGEDRSMSRRLRDGGGRLMSRANEGTRKGSARRRRGAVMVEAALVLPVLVTFFAFGVFFHRAYSEKIRIRAEAREAAFTAASRGCPSGSSNSSESSMQTGAMSSAVGKSAANKGDGTSTAMDFSHGTATAKKTASVSWKTGAGTVAKQIKPAESTVYCNENPIVTSAASWLDFGMNGSK